MSNKPIRSDNIVTNEFILSWPYLFEHEPNELNPDSKQYTMSLIFKDGKDCQDIIDGIMSTIAEAHPNVKTYEQAIKMGLKMPYKFGDEVNETRALQGKEPLEHQAGCIIFKARTNKQPVVTDIDHSHIIDTTKIYAGCFARTQLIASYWDNKSVGAKGVTLYFNIVHKTKDGEPISAYEEPVSEEIFK